MNIKNFPLNVVFLVIIVIIGLFIISFETSSFRDVIFWHNDDTFNLSPAVNLSQGNGFVRNYAPPWGSFSTNELIERYPKIISDEITKGPFYPIVMASFFILTSSEPSNYYDSTIQANSLLYLIFLISTYFLLIKFFPKFVVFVSVLLIAMFPPLAILSIKNLPILLSFVLVNFSLFFIRNNFRHYIIFGIFVGLAHLTHPFGLIPIISYVVFLFLKKEFKGSIIVSVISLGLGIPWYFRTYQISLDPFRGLGTNAITSISSDEQKFSLSFDSFSYFSNLLFSEHSFFSIVTPFIMSVIGILFLFYLLKKKTSLDIPFLTLRYYQFIPIFIGFLLIGSFTFGLLYGQFPAIQNLSYFYIFLIPFGVYSLYFLIKKFPNIKFKIFYKTVFSLLLIILCLFSYFDLTKTNDLLEIYTNENKTNLHSSESFFIWINENIQYDSIIATNNPQLVYTYTTLTSIGLPNSGNVFDEYFLSHYNPDYIIYFAQERKTPDQKISIFSNNYFTLQDDDVRSLVTIYSETDPITNLKSSIFKFYLIDSVDEYYEFKEVLCKQNSKFCEKYSLDLEMEISKLEMEISKLERSSEKLPINQYNILLNYYDEMIFLSMDESKYWYEKIKLLIKLEQEEKSFGVYKDFIKLSSIFSIYEKLDDTEKSSLLEIANLYKNADAESYEIFIYHILLSEYRFDPEIQILLADAYERNNEQSLALRTIENIRTENLSPNLIEQIDILMEKLSH